MADNILTKDRDGANIALSAKDIAGVLAPRNIITDPAGNDLTPLTDAALRASAVPVSADALPLPAGASSEITLASVLTAVNSLAAAISNHDAIAADGHGGMVILAKRRDSDASAMVADGDFGYISLDENQRVKVATQPASVDSGSGSITANGQNVSIKCGRFGNIAVSMVATTLVGHNASFECSNNSTNGTDGNWYGVQAVRSNANTVEAATGVIATTPIYMWHVNVGDYGYFRVRATAHTSGTAAYILKPGAYATEPIPAVQITGTQPVSGTVTATVANATANPAVPTTPYFLNSAATTNGALVITGTSNVSSFYATNEGASVAYVKLYNKATAPTVGTDVPEMIIPVPAAASGVPGVANPNIGFHGFRFALGLGIAVTRNAVYTDTTAIGAAEVKVKISRAI